MERNCQLVRETCAFPWKSLKVHEFVFNVVSVQANMGVTSLCRGPVLVA